jgi:hypothetical protein
MSKEHDSARDEKERRLRELGLRDNPDHRPVCIHCGQQFNPASGGAMTEAVGLCGTCLD